MERGGSGRVYLVGAGPGDPGLITVKGLRALQAADVVVYDRLANPRLLAHAPEQAERLYVGKSAHKHAYSQQEINSLLVEWARAGHVVCRLKGGDPFVFGRGGEEAEALAAAGIWFEVVPGVTSAIAAAAYAGIPVTHRGLCATLAIVTGHAAGRPEDPIAWEHLAGGIDTAVFLMGVESLPEIAANLLRHGRAPETPVALVRWGTTAQQEILTGTLRDIAEQARDAGFRSPAVIVVGEVARLRERLRWYDNRPLFGRRVLVTRAREQASELSRLIEDAGGEPVEFPVIRIRPVAEVDLSGLDRSYDWVVFTSINGVRYLVEALRAAGRDIRALGGAKLAAIGPATAGALAALGLRVDFTPSRFVAEAVLEEFPEPVTGRRILLARAREARDVLPNTWRAAGAEVDVLPVYETVADGADADLIRAEFAAGRIDAVTFTASSTVRHFRQLLPDVALESAVVACIGPITAATARELDVPVHVEAAEHTMPWLVRALEGALAAGAAACAARGDAAEDDLPE